MILDLLGSCVLIRNDLFSLDEMFPSLTDFVFDKQTDEYDLIVDIDSNNKLLKGELKQVLDNNRLDLAIRQSGSKYEIYFVNQVNIKIGFLDEKSGKACFNHYHNDLTKRIFLTFLRSCLQVLLPKKGSFIIHACGLINDDKGYLFPGQSGAGKTTIAGISDGVEIISDELIGVVKDDDEYYLSGTPWYPGSIRTVKFNAILLPVHSSDLYFETVKPSEAVKEILSNILILSNMNMCQQLLEIVNRLVMKVPVYRMGFALNSNIWDKIPFLTRKESYVTS